MTWASDVQFSLVRTLGTLRHLDTPKLTSLTNQGQDIKTRLCCEIVFSISNNLLAVKIGVLFYNYRSASIIMVLRILSFGWKHFQIQLSSSNNGYLAKFNHIERLVVSKLWYTRLTYFLNFFFFLVANSDLEILCLIPVKSSGFLHVLKLSIMKIWWIKAGDIYHLGAIIFLKNICWINFLWLPCFSINS